MSKSAKRKMDELSWRTYRNKSALWMMWKEIPSVNLYMMNGLKYFHTRDEYDDDEWSQHYIPMLFGFFDPWVEKDASDYDTFINALNSFGPKQKCSLSDVIGIVAVFWQEFSDVDTSWEVVDETIRAYIRINGIKNAQKFYEDAEMMSFSEKHFSVERVNQMYDEMSNNADNALWEISSQLWLKLDEWDVIKWNQKLKECYDFLRKVYPNFRAYSLRAMRYIDTLNSMGEIVDDNVSQEDWEEAWNLYLEHTDRKSRNVPWVTIDMEKQLWPKAKHILHLRTVDSEWSEYIALWNIRTKRLKAKWRSHLQKKALNDGFFPKLDDESAQKEIDYGDVHYGIPFWVKQNGELEIYGESVNRYEELWISPQQLDKMRAYILWYLAQLTNTDYEFIWPQDLTWDVWDEKNKKEDEFRREMPWMRQIIEKEQTLWSDDSRVIDSRESHTRLLPAWWTPSATHYQYGQTSNMALFAYLENKQDETMQEVCRIDRDSDGWEYSYEDFLNMCNQLRDKYDKGNFRIRLQTYVKKFDRSVIDDTKKAVPKIVWFNETVPVLDV